MSSSAVLIFGYDDQLLSSRRWVLEGKGFRVRTATELAEAEQILHTGSIKVLVLCHTLSAENYESILAIARRIRPETGILVLDSDRLRRPASEGTTVLSDFPSPGALIASVQGIAERASLIPRPSFED